MTSNMRAVALRQHGGIEQLKVEEWPRPVPAEHQALVEIKACGLNYMDVFVTHGMPDLPTEMPRIPGGDIAGVVREVGAGVSRDWIGKNVVLFPRFPGGGVLGEHGNGGLCDYIAVSEQQLIEIPDGVSFDDAAALPIAYGTSHRMLFTRGRIRKGEKVLVLGASGGVGVSCVQFAKMAGAEVYACTSSEEKGQKLREIGADHIINYVETPDFSRAVWTATGKTGVDVAINFTGGDTWIQTERCMATNGRILTCGSTAGHLCQIDIRFIWHREIEIVGSRAYQPEDIKACLDHVASGALKPVVEHRLPLERAGEGVGLLESRNVFGKVIVNP
ncbi:Quinone oxidoreductase 1 [Hartmannibacter diazotrophicus]|uniref:Quinone oxidoreductase 1 n=1 Tax=Hartmannibacter diazotrophicus TaxID=1482074 RepID=A0A2C9D0X8_9HYPH|nr:zinc-binding dehydrogenase [Hartmannibacter diazotrophicus]SON53896.1 Quinone oxidoreductase 1 [Hartmannibacter diazotrophicus]